MMFVCLLVIAVQSLTLVHSFGSSGGGTSQPLLNPDEAFSLLLVSYGGSPWMGFHGGDGKAAIS